MRDLNKTYESFTENERKIINVTLELIESKDMTIERFNILYNTFVDAVESFSSTTIKYGCNNTMLDSFNRKIKKTEELMDNVALDLCAKYKVEDTDVYFRRIEKAA